MEVQISVIHLHVIVVALRGMGASLEIQGSLMVVFHDLVYVLRGKDTVT